MDGGTPLALRSGVPQFVKFGNHWSNELLRKRIDELKSGGGRVGMYSLQEKGGTRPNKRKWEWADMTLVRWVIYIYILIIEYTCNGRNDNRQEGHEHERGNCSM